MIVHLKNKEIWESDTVTIVKLLQLLTMECKNI